MPLQRRLCLLLLCAGLGACAQQLPPAAAAPPPPVIAPGQCNEAAAQFAVGKAIDAKLAEELRVRASAQRVRMVRPGQMVTMEYDAGRLTLDIDAAGRVARVRCG
ncbi:MAG: I78 family peptidase inhibitor [Burkholderiales bacterium]|nr:I78 family peptidase inhibitor [Burkholderiales bacterium]